ncbi:endonuclease exonuclease phosphatase domain containing protein [Elysia marginata]|uniref:Endonuclease exonuclease phosphatase domain containing protein n=1 Tax=Elysia marginata TaxID=1093978 RepID=A0AAV4FA44_9GAST|nr:endonuclease exonuclease phosphatase domain containing protein [Elysia marginata]
MLKNSHRCTTCPVKAAHPNMSYLVIANFNLYSSDDRTYPGEDIGSDHDLVLAAFKLKLNSKRKAKSPRLHFDLEKLKDPNISETFRAQIGGKFAALTLIDNDVDTMANSLKEVLASTAEEVLGRKRRTIQPLVTNEVLDLCDNWRTKRSGKR